MNDLDLDLAPEPRVSAAKVAEARRRRALVARIAGDRGGRYARSGKGGDDVGAVPAVAPDGDTGRTSAQPSPSLEETRPTALSLSEAFDPPGSVAASDAAPRPLPLRARATAAMSAPIVPMPADAAPGSAATAHVPTPTARRAAAGDTVGPTQSRPTPSLAAPPGATSARSPVMLADALVVPAGGLVRGYLRCRALLLAGDIVGNVHCTAGPVVIRAGASLTGRLVASGDVYVCGTVADTGGGAVISTHGKLTLAAGARIDGDVRSARLDLHDGAMLAGVAKACED